MTTTIVDPADAGWITVLPSLRVTAKGYLYCQFCVNYKRTAVSVARMIVDLVPGDPRQVDHINRVRLDNRRANLRIVTAQENQQNLSPMRHRGGRPVISPYRGVTRARNGRWYANVTIRGQRRYLGLFDKEEDAASAVRAALLEIGVIV